MSWFTAAVVAVVVDLPDEDPETICGHIAMSPIALATALARAGRPDLARPYWRLAKGPRTTRPHAETLDEVLLLAGESPDEVCRRLGMTPGAVARALSRTGRPDLARPFWRADRRARPIRDNHPWTPKRAEMHRRIRAARGRVPRQRLRTPP